MKENKNNSSGLNVSEHEEKENEERWLLTYADMITLLVAFFIMMYSMSVLNLEKFKQVAFSIRSGFMGEFEGKKGNEISSNKTSDNIISKISIDNQYNYSANNTRNFDINSEMQKIEGKISELLITKKLQHIIDLKSREGNIYIIILTDKIFFKYGEKELTEEAKEILTELGAIIKPLPNEITIEGYTSKYKENIVSNNWELSAARALSVINFFEQEIKIDSRRMSLTGYGEWRPYNDDPYDNKNDRVVIAIMKKKFKKGGN